MQLLSAKWHLDPLNSLNTTCNLDSQTRSETHLGLLSRLDLAPKRLESLLSHHLMTRLDLKFS